MPFFKKNLDFQPKKFVFIWLKTLLLVITWPHTSLIDKQIWGCTGMCIWQLITVRVFLVYEKSEVFELFE